MPTCIDCGAPVVHKSRAGSPPQRCPGCRADRLRELSRRSTRGFMDRHPQRAAKQSREASARQRAADPEKHRERYRQWRAANPDGRARTSAPLGRCAERGADRVRAVRRTDEDPLLGGQTFRVEDERLALLDGRGAVVAVAGDGSTRR